MRSGAVRIEGVSALCPPRCAGISLDGAPEQDVSENNALEAGEPARESERPDRCEAFTTPLGTLSEMLSETLSGRLPKREPDAVSTSILEGVCAVFFIMAIPLSTV